MIREVGATLHLAYFAAGDESSAVVRFAGVRDWHYGYLNDEDLDAHPLYGLGLKFYAFHVGPVSRHGQRAWVATFHDGTLTVFAESLDVLTAGHPGDPSGAINEFAGEGTNRLLDEG